MALFQRNSHQSIHHASIMPLSHYVLAYSDAWKFCPVRWHTLKLIYNFSASSLDFMLFFRKWLISVEDDRWEIGSRASVFRGQKSIFHRQRTNQSFQIEQRHKHIPVDCKWKFDATMQVVCKNANDFRRIEHPKCMFKEETGTYTRSRSKIGLVFNRVRYVFISYKHA